MSNRNADEVDADELNPKELREWLQDELMKVKRAAEIRSQNATEFVTACSTGAISTEEANRKLMEYWRRWGETPFDSLGDITERSDSQIIKLLDEKREARQRGGRVSGYER